MTEECPISRRGAVWSSLWLVKHFHLHRGSGLHRYMDVCVNVYMWETLTCSCMCMSLSLCVSLCVACATVAHVLWEVRSMHMQTHPCEHPHGHAPIVILCAVNCQQCFSSLYMCGSHNEAHQSSLLVVSFDLLYVSWCFDLHHRQPP